MTNESYMVIQPSDLYKALTEQEKVAPSREEVTRNNHYVPRFYQRYWGKGSDTVFTISANSKSGVRPTSTRRTMAHNFLYTVKELTNPNIFEKERLPIEISLAQAIEKASKNNHLLDGRHYALLLSMMLHGSPSSIKNYRRAVMDHILLGGGQVEPWGVNAMASSFMIHAIKSLASQIFENYSFSVQHTKEALVLSDYPVIQLIAGRQVHPLLGFWSPESDQIILPLNPHSYLLATKRVAPLFLVANLTASSINEFSLKSAQLNLIGESEIDLTTCVRRADLSMPFLVLLPMKVPLIEMGPGSIRDLILTSKGIMVRGWNVTSRTPPLIYEESGLSLRY